jgi:glycosyltransferase involved in cell wall biosynthesis
MTAETRPIPAPLRILDTHPPLPYAIVAADFIRTGGMDRANHALAQHLARSGHETHVVSFRVADDLAAEPNVHVHLAPRPWKRVLLGAPFLGALGLLEARRLGPTARVIVNGGNCPVPDAVNWVHYVHAAEAAVRPRISKRRSFIPRSTERVALSRARLVVANSERTRRDLIDHLAIPESKIRLVYLGVDPDEFRPRSADERGEARAALGWDDRPRIVFVGALGDGRKGFAALFAAFRRLARRSSFSAQLVVVGTGKALPIWKARAAEAGLERRIDFLGFRSDVARVVSASEVLVAAPLYEPYGLGVHEALCTEVPAIVSASSGVAERYPSALSDLLLPDPLDDADLAARIERVLIRSRPFPGLAAFARDLRARTWEKVAADIVALTEA